MSGEAPHRPPEEEEAVEADREWEGAEGVDPGSETAEGPGRVDPVTAAEREAAARSALG